jgi:hypothetical protein
MSELELINIVASSERTPQLTQYWVKRYKKFLDEKLFVISDKTKLLLSQVETTSSPTTPFGHIDLLRFVNKNKGLEEVALQNTVETAIRFLDSCVDKINFTDDARQIVVEFRKIGLGVIGFDEYLIAKNATSKEDEINYLGNIISGSAYRASEALAEEKGICGKWNTIKIALRPKPFEFWYDTVNGDIKNGLELMEEFDQDTVEQSDFEIIPRRNSHILLYPNESSWQLWSDRDETSSPKAIKVQIEDNANIVIDDSSFVEPSYADKKSKGLESTKKLLDIGAIVKSGKKVVHEWFMEDAKAEELFDTNLNKKVGAIESMLDETTGDQIKFGSSSFNSFTDPKITDETVVNKFAFPRPTEFLKQSLTNFTINDIVKVINKKSELYGNIFQINELEYDEESKNHFATLDSEQGIVVRDSEIEKMTIDELLTDSKVLHEVTSSAVIFSQDGQKVALQNNSKLLPQVNKCNIKENLDSQLLETLKKMYDLTPEFTDISSVIVKQERIIVAYILTLNSDNLNDGLGWFNVNEVYDHDSRNLVAVSAEKLRRLQNSIKSKANDLLKEQVELLEGDYQQKIEDEKITISNTIKLTYDSQLKDLKYKIQEKTKELYDYKEAAENIKSESLANQKNEYESQIKNLNDLLENLQNNSSSLSKSKSEIASQVLNLQNTIQDNVVELNEVNNLLIQKENLFNQTQQQYEIEIDELKKQLTELENSHKSELVEIQKLIDSKNDEFNKVLEERNKKANLDLTALENTRKSELSEIQKLIDSKYIEYNESVSNIKTNYESQIEKLKLDLESKNDEIANIVVSKDEDLNKALDEQTKKATFELEELENSHKSELVEIQKLIDSKHEEYTLSLETTKADYQSGIQVLNSKLSSKDKEIKNLVINKDNELRLALDEQNKVRLDLEQMCLARVAQQKQSQLEFENNQNSRFENQSKILATKYDSDIQRLEEEFNLILTNKEDSYKVNLNRQKQYYEDLIQKMSFNITDSLVTSVISKPIKIQVEEPEPEIKSSVNHSKDEIFQQTRDNLFKPNNVVKINPITQTTYHNSKTISHTATQSSPVTEQDTLKTLLRMKGVARK